MGEIEVIDFGDTTRKARNTIKRLNKELGKHLVCNADRRIISGVEERLTTPRGKWKKGIPEKESAILSRVFDHARRNWENDGAVYPVTGELIEVNDIGGYMSDLSGRCLELSLGFEQGTVRFLGNLGKYLSRHGVLSAKQVAVIERFAQRVLDFDNRPEGTIIFNPLQEVSMNIQANKAVNYNSYQEPEDWNDRLSETEDVLSFREMYTGKGGSVGLAEAEAEMREVFPELVYYEGQDVTEIAFRMLESYLQGANPKTHFYGTTENGMHTWSAVRKDLAGIA
jgi:hypothetical protein